MNTGALISQLEFFSGLTSKQTEAIAAITNDIEAQKGDVIFVEAKPANRLYFLKEGKVSIKIQLSSSPEQIVVASVNIGFGFGWSALVEPHFFTASAICEADSKIAAVDGQKLLDILHNDPVAGSLIFRRTATIISKRLRNSRSALLKTL